MSRCDAMWYDAMRYDAILCQVMACDAIQNDAVCGQRDITHVMRTMRHDVLCSVPSQIAVAAIN